MGSSSDIKKAIAILKKAIDIQKRLKKGKIDLSEARLEMMYLEHDARSLGIPIPAQDYFSDDSNTQDS